MTGSIKPSKAKKPFLLGVAGGSGSGKTYFARALQAALGDEVCTIVYQDNYYIDQSKKFDHDGGAVNFDHPSSLDFELLGKQLGLLKQGQIVDIPIYDFVTHTRKSETLRVEPKSVIIIDGILIFHANQVRPHFDDMIYFDTPETLRFSRRLERDVSERGREPEGVHAQFYRQVKPMHDQFVEPSKKHAGHVVCEIAEYEKVLSNFIRRLSI